MATIRSKSSHFSHDTTSGASACLGFQRDVTMWVFEKECDLAKGWPPILFKGERASDAGKYTILAQEMVSLIKEYLAGKRDATAHATD
jgi:hypothetical protein